MARGRRAARLALLGWLALGHLGAPLARAGKPAGDPRRTTEAGPSTPVERRPAHPSKGAEHTAPGQALLTAADEITRQVAALRGLEPKRKIERGVVSRAEIGARLKERIAKEYTPEEVRTEARVLRRLGLLPPGVDYQQLLVDLLMEQVAGFYDPFAGKLFIADWLPLEMQRPALAHELQHALQDQHFDLKRFTSPIKDNGDLQLAHAALIEGDGTATMLEFQAQSLGLPIDQLPDMVAQLGEQMLKGGLGQTPLFDQAPPFLRETLIFPYLGGLGFVESFRKQAPWSRVDALWKEPPASTEQVLHPEKYLAKERPTRITAAPVTALGPLRELRRDVLGELEWRLLFELGVARPIAEKAAAGWGGDRLVAYADPAGPDDAPVAVIDLSVWDSEADAREAEAALRPLLAKLAGRRAPARDRPRPLVDPRGDLFAVERRGARVLVLFGVPSAAHPAIARQVWDGWTIAP